MKCIRKTALSAGVSAAFAALGMGLASNGHGQVQIDLSVDREPEVKDEQTGWQFGDPTGNPPGIPNAVHDDFLIPNPDQASQIYLHPIDPPADTRRSNFLDVPAVNIGAAAPPFDFFNVDAVMRNRGPMVPNRVLPGLAAITNLYFSVEDRPGQTEGAPDTRLRADSEFRFTTDPNANPAGPSPRGDGSTAGNIYYALTAVLPCRGFNFRLPRLSDQALGLKPDQDRVAEFPMSLIQEDNLDALNIEALAAGAWDPPEPVYFSVVDDWTNDPPLAANFTPGAIWVSSQDGSFRRFATAETMGLIPARMEAGEVIAGDDVDAFVIWDADEDQELDPGVDMALFSVRPGGPSELDPGTVFYTDFRDRHAVAGPANVPVAYPLLAANLGLRSGDLDGDGRIRGPDEDTEVFDNLDALEELQYPDFVIVGDPPPDPDPPVVPPPPQRTIELPVMLDFGDNPATYGTAVHRTIGKERLGASIDLENKDLPSPKSDKDDRTQGLVLVGPPTTDDEDGEVAANANGVTLRVDSERNFQLRRRVRHYRIDGYFDRNSNGTYEPATEHFGVAFNMQPAPPNGVTTVMVRLPTPFDPRPFNRRYRLSLDRKRAPGIAPPTGLVQNGEVEDYPGRMDDTMKDWGDAPDLGMVVLGLPRNYRTVIATNGPRYQDHALQKLGKLDDGEPFGQPTAFADGDDAAGIDDEDGVQFLNAKQVRVSVTNNRGAVASFQIDAWIDCNAENGRFDHPAERFIHRVVAIPPGTQAFDFRIPAGFPDTCDLRRHYTRFRLTYVDGIKVNPNQNIPPTGEIRGADGISHGEVEDYPGTKSKERMKGDLNGDGSVDMADIDIIVASFGTEEGDSSFDPRADVARDGRVDIRDLAWVAGVLD